MTADAQGQALTALLKEWATVNACPHYGEDGGLCPDCRDTVIAAIIAERVSNVHPKVVEAGQRLIAGDIEEAMERLSEFFEIDAQRNAHPTVKALLLNCRDAARNISMDWYVSTK